MSHALEIAYGILLAGVIRGLFVLGVLAVFLVLTLLGCSFLDWRHARAYRRHR